MRSKTLVTALLAVLPVQQLYAQNTWDRIFDGSQALPIQSPAPLAPAASEVLIIGPRITLLLDADQSNQQAAVWPGYSVFGQPILLYEAGVRSFLLAHPNPPAGYNAVLSSPQPVFEKEGPLPDLNFPFQFHRMVNKIDSFAYRYQPGGKPERDVHTIVHERFHVHQEKGFSGFTHNKRRSEPDAEDLALAALEQRTLRSALKAVDTTGSSRFVRQFLAARAERYARQPDSRDPETDQERSEGMAEYVEVNLMNRPGVAPTPGGILTVVTAELDRFPTIDAMVKFRYYATGAAQGLLLDRTGRADWKEAVSAGASLSSLVALAYPMASGSGQALLAEAKSEHGYEELLKTGTQLAGDFQTQKALAISEYENAPGIEWTVPVPWDKETNFGFSGANPEFKLSNTETLRPHLILLDITGTAFTLHFTNRPAVMGSGVRFHAAAEAALLLNGSPFALSDGAYPFGTLSLTEAGLALNIARPGTLTVTGSKAVLSYPGRRLAGRSLLE